MTDTRNLLKNAFIDAQRDMRTLEPHVFSQDFENKMTFLIKSQKGALKLINTVGKRVAILVLAFVIITASTVFGVEAIRTPVVNAIQEFFVNIKQELSGSMARNVAHFFPDDAVELRAISYTSSVPKTEVIKDPERIKEFTKLLASTEWLVPPDTSKYQNTVKTYLWEFCLVDSKGESISIKTCSIGRRGIVLLTAENKESIYTLSRDAYRNIISFTGERYYLHKSDLEIPDREYSRSIRAKALSGLSGETAQAVKKELWNIHCNMEDFLLANVTRLKDPDSKVWDFVLYGGHHPDEPVYSPKGFSNILSDLKNLIDTVKDETTVATLTKVSEDLTIAFEGHDIGLIFIAHEYIHDLDYFAIDYPKYCDTPPPDWAGVEVYFGRLQQIYGEEN